LEEYVKKHGMKMLVALFALLAAQMVFAQDSMSNMGGAMGGANKQEVMAKLDKISANLQLTPAQKKQMLPILMQEAPKLQAVKGDTALGPLQKAMKLKEIGSDTDSKVMPILNPEQQQKWQAMRAQERQQMMQKMENH
jgi:hypothetical protein